MRGVDWERGYGFLWWVGDSERDAGFEDDVGVGGAFAGADDGFAGGGEGFEVGVGDFGDFGVHAVAVEARLHRMAGHRSADSAPGPRHVAVADGALSLAERMAAYVALHYRQPLSAAEIARSVGLHPNYAMTVFRRTFGTTLIGYVTQHRLSHAQRLLVTTTRPVIDIAFEAGFGSLSRFHKCFRDAFGCTPLDFRVSSRDGV